MKFLMLAAIILSICSCNKSSGAWHGGNDSNDNGIRDDIETWIESEYADSKDVKFALLKLAAVDPASCEYKDKLICLEQVSDDALLIQLKLLEKTLDTSERRVAFEKRVQKCVILDDRNLNVKCNF